MVKKNFHQCYECYKIKRKSEIFQVFSYFALFCRGNHCPQTGTFFIPTIRQGDRPGSPKRDDRTTGHNQEIKTWKFNKPNQTPNIFSRNQKTIISWSGKTTLISGNWYFEIFFGDCQHFWVFQRFFLERWLQPFFFEKEKENTFYQPIKSFRKSEAAWVNTLSFWCSKTFQ